MRAWSTPSGRDDSFALQLSVRALPDEETAGHVVVAAGALGAPTVHRLRECLDGLVAQGCRSLVLDLNALTFVDASALGLLVRTRARLSDAGGVLRVVYGENPALVSLLRLTQLDLVFGPDRGDP